MSRKLVLAAGAAGLALIAVAPATASAQTAATTTVCGASGLQAGLNTRVCADITGDQVEVYGRVSLAGPPSPGSPSPFGQELFTTLTSEAPAGTLNRSVIFNSSIVEVRGISGTVACGSTVKAGFAVASYPWSPRPVSLETTVTC
ncbi:hypothetical protein ACGFX4_03400 [Kitasatospora sp. NPDC048365]|uniref:hypothetical protein n=1 Tax=Kitasatospora sp. NPDC048365 TaxID=3364050 RepID=UPI0037162BC6